jgi:hypothetical protein
VLEMGGIASPAVGRDSRGAAQETERPWDPILSHGRVGSSRW